MAGTGRDSGEVARAKAVTVAEHLQSRRLAGLIKELREKYGNRTKVRSPCWVFNKKMFRPTVERTASFWFGYHISGPARAFGFATILNSQQLLIFA